MRRNFFESATPCSFDLQTRECQPKGTKRQTVHSRDGSDAFVGYPSSAQLGGDRRLRSCAFQTLPRCTLSHEFRYLASLLHYQRHFSQSTVSFIPALFSRSACILWQSPGRNVGGWAVAAQV